MAEKKKASSAKKAPAAKKATSSAKKKAPAKKKATSAPRAAKKRQATHDEIAKRAYEIHEREGGNHEDNWHRAERELRRS
jgi:Protein of unknown function (DUF2934)